MKNPLLASLLGTFVTLIGSSEAHAQVDLRVYVSDALSGTSPAGLTVQVLDSDGLHSSITDENGVVEFVGLLPHEPDQPDQLPSLIFETESTKYLPLHKVVVVTPETWFAQLSVVPARSGYSTPVINAVKGGEFKLPGLGSLSVQPGVLAADSRLQLSVIPSHATSRSMVDGQLKYELWCQAYSPDGTPQPGTLPLHPEGVTLTVTLPRPTDPAEELASETWTTYSFDQSWQPIATAETTTVEIGDEVVVGIPLMEGFNLLERDYRTVSQPAGCEWGPWQFRLVFISETTVLGGGQSQSVSCGHYSENDCFSIQAGIEQSTNWEGGVEIETKTEVAAGRVFAEISASVGTKVSGKYGESTVTTVSLKRERCKENGQPIHGVAPLSPPWSCIDAVVTMAQAVSKYRITATRGCVEPNGAIRRQNVSGGTIDIPGSIINVWTNVSINPACPGCDTDPPQQVPMPLPK